MSEFVLNQSKTESIRVKTFGRLCSMLKSFPEAALCVTAERVGNLPEVLRALALSIEQRRNRKLRVLADLLKPVIVCTLGLVVGLFVIALFIPIVQLIFDFS